MKNDRRSIVEKPDANPAANRTQGGEPGANAPMCLPRKHPAEALFPRKFLAAAAVAAGVFSLPGAVPQARGETYLYNVNFTNSEANKITLDNAGAVKVPAAAWNQFTTNSGNAQALYQYRVGDSAKSTVASPLTLTWGSGSHDGGVYGGVYNNPQEQLTHTGLQGRGGVATYTINNLWGFLASWEDELWGIVPSQGLVLYIIVGNNEGESARFMWQRINDRVWYQPITGGVQKAADQNYNANIWENGHNGSGKAWETGANLIEGLGGSYVKIDLLAEGLVSASEPNLKYLMQSPGSGDAWEDDIPGFQLAFTLPDIPISSWNSALGTGNWDTAVANWQPDGGGAYGAWSNGVNVAKFASNATIAVNETIEALGLWAASGNVVLNLTDPAASLALRVPTGGAGRIRVDDGAALKIVLGAGQSLAASTIKTSGSGALSLSLDAADSVFTVSGACDFSLSELSGAGTLAKGAAGNAAWSVASGNFSGTISNAGGTLALSKTGAGLFVFSGSALGAGIDLVVREGTLAVPSGAVMGSGQVTLAGGAIQLTGAGEDTAKNIVLSGNAAIKVASGDPADDAAPAISARISGVISGSGKTLTKTGPGTLELAGANNYGNTVISTGTLAIHSAANLGTGPGEIKSPATLSLLETGDYSAIPWNYESGAAIEVPAAGKNATLRLSATVPASDNDFVKTGFGHLELAASGAGTFGRTTARIQSGSLGVSDDFALVVADAAPDALAAAAETAAAEAIVRAAELEAVKADVNSTLEQRAAAEAAADAANVAATAAAAAANTAAGSLKVNTAAVFGGVRIGGYGELSLAVPGASLGTAVFGDKATLVLPPATADRDTNVHADSITLGNGQDPAVLLLDLTNVAGIIGLNPVSVFHIDNPPAPGGNGTFAVKNADSIRSKGLSAQMAPDGTVSVSVGEYVAPHVLVWMGASDPVSQDSYTWATGRGSGFVRWVEQGTGFEEQFYQADDVIFNDAPVSGGFPKSYVVNIAEGVQPGSVLVDSDNLLEDYRFEGTGGIGGAAKLTKDGSGTLVIQNANTYLGGTEIRKGTVRMLHESALGPGLITMSGGALSGNQSIKNDMLVHESFDFGWGAGSAGDSDFDASATLIYSGSLKSTKEVVITFPAGTDAAGHSNRVFSSVDNADFTGTLVFTRKDNAFTGAGADWRNTTIEWNAPFADRLGLTGAGTVRFREVRVDGASVEIGSNTTLDLPVFVKLGSSASWAAPDPNFANRQRIYAATPSANARLTSRTGTITFNIQAGRTDLLVPVIDVSATEAVKVVKTGAGTLVLTSVAGGNPHTYTGGLVIDGGEVRVGRNTTDLSFTGNIGLVDDRAGHVVTINNRGRYFIDGAMFAYLSGAELPLKQILVNEGGELSTNSYNRLANVTLHGGTLTATGGAGEEWGAWQLVGELVVTGENLVSHLTGSGTGGSRVRLGYGDTPGQTTLNVASGAVLEATVRLGDAGKNIAVASAFAAGGASTLVKSGAGRLVLVADSDYTGGTQVKAGVLQIGGSADATAGTATGRPGASTMSNVLEIFPQATLDLRRTGDAVFSHKLLLPEGSTLIKQDGGTGRLAFNNAGASVRGTVQIKSGTLEFSSAATLAPERLEIAGNAAFSSIGGNLQLATAQSSFAGREIVSPGARDIALGAGTLTLSGGHTLHVGTNAVAETLSVSGKVVLAGGKLGFDIGGADADKIDILGTFDATGGGIIVLRGDAGTWNASEYSILTVSGAFAADPAASLSLDYGNVLHGEKIIPSLISDSNTLKIKLRYSHGVLVWNDNALVAGATLGVWDTTSPNWLSRETGSPFVFRNDDGVEAFSTVFNDEHPDSSTSVSIPVPVSPFAVVVESVRDFTFANTATGRISGEATFTKTGAGTLVLQGSEGAALNDFTRTFFASEGVIELRGPQPLLAAKAQPSLLGAGKSASDLVLDGGTLRFNGEAGNVTKTDRSFTLGDKGATLEAAATDAGTLVWFSGADPVPVSGGGPRRLTLTGAGGAEAYANPSAARSATAGGVLGLALGGGTAVAVEKTGTGVWHLSGDNTFTGGLFVREGALSFSAAGALGDGAVTLVGGSLVLAAFDDGGDGVLFSGSPIAATVGKNLVFEGGALGVADGGELTLAGTSVSGSQPLLKNGAGRLILANSGDGTHGTNDNTAWTSGTHVAGGSVETLGKHALGTPSLGGKSGFLTLDPGAVTLLGNGSAVLAESPGDLEVSGLAGEGGIVKNGRAAAPSTLTLNTPARYADPVAPVFKGGFAENDAGNPLAIHKTGEGVQVLAGSSTLAAGSIVDVEGGVLRLASADALGAATIRLGSASGSLDIAAVDFSAPGAARPVVTISDTAAFITNSTGGATLPQIVLAADGYAKTRGSTTLGGVSGASGLFLDGMDGAPAPVFVVGPASDVKTSGVTVLSGVTLRLDASEKLGNHEGATSSAPTVTLLPNSRLEIPARGTTQTFAKIENTGSIGGFGTANFTGDSELDAKLTDSVNLSVAPRSTLRLNNPTSDTNGTLGIGAGAVLLSASQSDVFGRAAIAIASGGTLRLSSAIPVVLNEHDLHFTGDNAQIESTGRGVTISGTASFATDVGEGGGLFTLRLTGNPEYSGAQPSVFNVTLADPAWRLGAATRLVKDGAGTWVLASAGNSFTGGTTVARGTLKIGVENAIPAASALTLGSPNQEGILDLNGFNLDISSLSRDGGGGSIINTAATTARLAWTVNGAPQAYSASLGDTAGAAGNDFSFAKRGAGELTLSGGVHYTGGTVVEAGTLRIATRQALPASRDFYVWAGATLDVSPLADGVTLGAGMSLRAGSARSASTADLRGDLILGGGALFVGDWRNLAGAGTLRLDGSLSVLAPESEIIFGLDRYPGSGNSLLDVGALNLSTLAPGLPLGADGAGNLRFNLAAAYATPGDYTLIRYGAISGDPLAELKAAVVDFHDDRYSAELVDVPAGDGTGQIVLRVHSTGDVSMLEWVGGLIGHETYWDYSSPNFSDGSGNQPYGIAARARFSDAKAAGYDVYLPQSVVIGDVVFDNSARAFTVSGAAGAGLEGEGRLTKYGTGDLVLRTANGYRGKLAADGVTREAATYLYDGRILLGDDNALGADPVRVFGGALGKDGPAARRVPNTLEIVPNASFSLDAGDAGSLEVAGAVTGGEGATITKAGTAPLLFSGDLSKFSGSVQALAGALVLREGADLSGATLRLSGSATLELAGIPGGAVYKIGSLEGSAGTSIAAGAAGTKKLEVGALGASAIFSGSFATGADILALDKVGGGSLTLSGDNAGLKGAVEVRAGVLRVGDGIGGTRIPGVITVHGGATLVMELPDSQELAAPGSTLIAKTGSTVEKRGANTLVLNQAYDNFEGTLLVSAGVIALSGDGTFGQAGIVNNATVRLDRADAYTFANSITGTGSLVKNGAGVATYLGAHTGSGVTYLNGGSLQFGDPTIPAAALSSVLKNQEHLAPIVTAAGTVLRLAPAEGIKLEPGKITVSDVTGSGRVEKTGGGLAVLNGAIGVHDASNAGADVHVFQGELRIGSRDPRDTYSTLDVGSAIRVEAGATLSVGRAGATYLRQAVTSEGAFTVLGDLNGGGTVVLASQANDISGKIAVQRASVLQVGDTVSDSRINDGTAFVEVTLDPRATLRFTHATGASTGANLTVLSFQPGAGVIEYDGGASFHFDSTTASGANQVFTGTFLASSGVFSLNVVSIPANTKLDARGAGTLLVLAEPSATAGVTRLSTALGSGDGNIALGSRTGAAVSYEMPEGARFAGSLSVGAAAALRLTPSSGVFAVRTLRVENGGILAGSGAVQGDLNNLVGGVVRPGASGEGRIDVTGNFLNSGLLEIQASGDFSVGSIHYTGSAVIDAAGTLVFRIPQSLHKNLITGAEFKFLVDDDISGPGGASSSLVGNFTPGNIHLQLTEDDGTPIGAALDRELLSYNKGDGGLTLLLGGDTNAINGFHLAPALDGWRRYLNDDILRGDNTALKAVVGQLLGAADIRKSFSAASPLGLASLAAMPLGMARDNADSLHNHLESLRFHLPRAKASGANFQPYVLGTGLFENNSSSSRTPAFNYRTYGAQVGLDCQPAERVVLGARAGYAHGSATLDHEAGTAKDDNVRAAIYGTAILDRDGRWYAEASAFAGHSSYDVRHNSVSGVAKASPKGFDGGATASAGGVFTLPGLPVHVTPYAGLEYAIASVDGFTERATGAANDAALRIEQFEHDSLRAKLGFGVSWIVPTYADFNLRLGFNAAYHRELLDTKVPMRGAFAADHSGARFKVDAPGIFQDFVQAGPTVDVDFLENMSFRANYNYGTDLRGGETHSVNATFTVRF
jgi:autotransporter-associated beta strand protein